MLSAEHLGLYEGPLQYAKVVGPRHSELTIELLAEVGINCQLLAHWVLEELCMLALPKDYLSSHFWADNQFMRPVTIQQERLQFGDIVFFYREYATLPENLHLAVVVDRNAAGQVLLLHCVKRRDKSEQAIVLWTLEDFATSRMHQHIFGARRITTQKVVSEQLSVDFDAKREWVYAVPFAEVLDFTTGQLQLKQVHEHALDQ